MCHDPNFGQKKITRTFLIHLQVVLGIDSVPGVLTWWRGKMENVSALRGGFLLVGETENKPAIRTAMPQCIERLKRWTPTAALIPFLDKHPGETLHIGEGEKHQNEHCSRSFICRRLMPASLVWCTLAKTWRGCGSLRSPRREWTC